MASAADVKQAFGPGGVMETVVKARDEGKVRWLGFSARHQGGRARTALPLRIDTVMYPVNFVEHYTHSSTRGAVPLRTRRRSRSSPSSPSRREAGSRAKRRPVTAGGTGHWRIRPRSSLAVRFSLSLDPVASVLTDLVH
jgi:hypothetical protein